ncbi:MAG: hypothetical protein NTW04_05535, partial [Elusimicrobia bacterium]|nr:hypothetical protein [Elusimicrobiota bacterium]
MRSTENTLRSIIESAEKRKLQKAQAKERIEKLAQEKLNAETELSARRGELKEFEVGESGIGHELQALKNEFDEKSKEVNSHKNELGGLKLRAHDLEMQISRRQEEKEKITAVLSENWQVSVEEARLKYCEVEVDNDRVKMMKRRLEGMGAINMTAPEEYDALTSRNQFLKTQMADLESAKTDLKSAIAKINATTRESFRKTFDAVREHFKKVYQTLFVGGEADLILTMPDNLLETGVEIVAQPPGKRLENISVLSGGEKALTSLALLLSFFWVNPSPFCVMDEADAPLDEANVER